MTSVVTMMTMLLRGMMHKALYPFLLLLVLGFNLSTAVGARGDSLRYELRKASVDSVRFSLYQQLVYTLLDSSLDAAVPFFVEWVDVALRSKTWSEAGRAEAIWGVAALQSGTLSDASTHFSRAIRYYDNAGESKGLGRAYNNLGITLRREGRFKEAFLSFLEARKQFQLADDAAGIAMVYNNLAQIYYQYEEYGQALEYFTITSTTTVRNTKPSRQPMRRTTSVLRITSLKITHTPSNTTTAVMISSIRWIIVSGLRWLRTISGLCFASWGN